MFAGLKVGEGIFIGRIAISPCRTPSISMPSTEPRYCGTRIVSVSFHPHRDLIGDVSAIERKSLRGPVAEAEPAHRRDDGLFRSLHAHAEIASR